VQKVKEYGVDVQIEFMRLKIWSVGAFLWTWQWTLDVYVRGAVFMNMFRKKQELCIWWRSTDTAGIIRVYVASCLWGWLMLPG